MKLSLCFALFFLSLQVYPTAAAHWNGENLLSLNYACYPNSTVVADNPDPHGFQTSFANDTTSVCTTFYNSAFTKLTITGCSLNDDILLVFTNRTEDYDYIIGGYGVDSYVIRCNNIPETGLIKTLIQGFTPAVQATTLSSIAPSVSIQSALRENYTFGSAEVNIAVLTTRLYWTIDIPEEYYGLPLYCYVVSGTDAYSPTALRKDLIQQGCSGDTNLVGHFLMAITQTPLRRLYTKFHVFKFYDSDYITIRCTVEYCHLASDCTANCGAGRRRREAPMAEDHSTMMSLKVLDRNSLLSGAPAIDFIPSAALPWMVFVQRLL